MENKEFTKKEFQKWVFKCILIIVGTITLGILITMPDKKPIRTPPASFDERPPKWDPVKDGPFIFNGMIITDTTLIEEIRSIQRTFENLDKYQRVGTLEFDEEGNSTFTPSK